MKSVFLFAVALFTSPAAHAAPTCADLLSDAKPAVAEMKLSATSFYASPNMDAYKALTEVKKLWPQLKTSRKQLTKALEEVLKDEELASFHLIMNRVFAETSKSIAQSEIRTDELSYAAFENALTAELLTALPAEQVEARVQILRGDSLAKREVMRAFGQQSQAESLAALVGPGGIDNVSPDSIIGRYLKAASEKGVTIQPLVETFLRTPDVKGSVGERRLFIAVDEKTAPIINALFANNANFLVHDHSFRQGTLELNHLGKNINYTSYKQARQFGTEKGSMMPVMVLSSTEGSRAFNYFELGRLSNNARSKYPWSLRDSKTDKSYCRIGGYNSCTHWFGEMPIGDRRVSEYAFPGKADAHAYLAAENVQGDQKAIRVGPVGTYDHFKLPYGEQSIGVESRTDRLTRIVWNQGRGHEQLWSMLGSRGELERGEFANPGWVLYSLIGSAPTERVPVVFVQRKDASSPLTAEILKRLRRNIHQY